MKRKIYKSLDKPSSLFGIKGSYITWVLFGAMGAIIIGALIGSFTNSLVGFLFAIIIAVVVYLYVINFQSRFTERERNKWLSSRGLPDVIIMRATPIKNYFGHKLTFKKKPIES